jgi:hypothetical protein
MIAPIGNRAAVALVAGFFATLFVVDWIGDTFGAFWGWCTVIAAGYTFVVAANNHERRAR